jgi:hypothetical protein
MVEKRMRKKGKKEEIIPIAEMRRKTTEMVIHFK